MKAQGDRAVRRNHFGDAAAPADIFGRGGFFGSSTTSTPKRSQSSHPTEDFPNFRKTGAVLHCWANGDGKQRIEDTGPLTKERMKTIDDVEVLPNALRFMADAKAAGTPFFTWVNTTHMHFRTHIKDGSRGKAGRWQAEYHDVMCDHDELVGELLNFLDELGLADNTIVMYSTDNGAEKFTWPDGGTSPFRGEKNTNWEGGYRVPCVVRWPNVIKPGTVFNDIVAHEDWVPTLLAAAGEPEIKQKLLTGYQIGDRTFKDHLDGYDQTGYFAGKAESPRKEFFYFSDDGDVMAVRVGDYKFNLALQHATTMELWAEPFVKLRMPHITNIRRDPFERADFNSNTYWDWIVNHAPQLYLMQDVVAEQIDGFAKFPPRQKPASFNLDAVMAQVTAVSGAAAKAKSAGK